MAATADPSATAAGTAAGTPSQAVAGSDEFHLVSELQPNHEGTVHAVAVVDANTIASGSDDTMAAVWRRLEGTDTFATMCMVPDAARGVRAACAIPPGVDDALPEGGFAAGSLDNTIRIYTLTGTKVRELKGHSGGIVSLCCFDGGAKILSGSWDGSARIWNTQSGACLQTLAGHENSTTAAVLPDGSIVTGSSGLKNAQGQHVDFKVRVFSPAGACLATLTDHDQAVRGVVPVPELGFATVSNDGTLRIRSSDGQVLDSKMSVTPEGQPLFTYSVGCRQSDGLLVTGAEDNCVRIFPTSSIGQGNAPAQVMRMPGVPWAFDFLPNGDLVVGCGQSGTSRKGHIYIFSTDPTRVADDMTRARFETDATPVKKPAGQEETGVPASQIKGDYDERANFPGSKEGEYGFFRRGGAVFACGWSTSKRQWEDIGEVQAGPGGGGGGAASGGGSGAGAGTAYEFTRQVTLDVPGGGLKTMTLGFNADEMPLTVARRFMKENGLSGEHYEEIRDFVIQNRLSAGLSALPESGPAKAAGGPSRRQFPLRAYIVASPLKADACRTKILSNSAEVGGELALTVGEQQTLQTFVADVVTREAFYHSVSLSEPQVALVAKLLRWPAGAIAPVIDLVRKVLLIRNGAAVAARGGFGPVLERCCELLSAPDAKAGLLVLVSRLLMNACKEAAMRSVVAAAAQPVCTALAPLVNFAGKPVVGASALQALQNVMSAAVSPPVEGFDAAVVVGPVCTRVEAAAGQVKTVGACARVLGCAALIGEAPVADAIKGHAAAVSALQAVGAGAGDACDVEACQDLVAMLG